jgi:hypothetical protein
MTNDLEQKGMIQVFRFDPEFNLFTVLSGQEACQVKIAKKFLAGFAHIE